MVTTPVGPRIMAIPATKSLMSGTCANTLLPITRSARSPPSTSFAARPAPKNSTSVSMPRSSATVATFAAGSMPSTGMSRSTKYWRRYPSFEASSTTWDSRVEGQPLRDGLDVAARVRQPGVGKRREVRVLAKDLFGRHELLELHEEALAAHVDVQRVESLGVVEHARGDEALAQRRQAEVHERGVQGRAAEPASGLVERLAGFAGHRSPRARRRPEREPGHESTGMTCTDLTYRRAPDRSQAPVSRRPGLKNALLSVEDEQ